MTTQLVLAALGGTVGSFYLDTATGATIVVTSILLLGLSWIIGGRLRRDDRFIPFIEDHGDHAHEPAHAHADPAHDTHLGDRVRIQHGDHIDYVHDGHRHAVHGDHYDEH